MAQAFAAFSARVAVLSVVYFHTEQDTLLAQRLPERPVDLPNAVNYDFLREAYREPLTSGNSGLKCSKIVS